MKRETSTSALHRRKQLKSSIDHIPTGLYVPGSDMKNSATRAPEETRRKILKTAFEEFHLHGFQGGSINRIVERTDTTKGALFHHFADKNALGYAVVEEVIRPVTKERWLDPLADSIDPISDLKLTVQRYSKDNMDSHRLEQGCPLNNLAQEMSPLDEGFRKRIENVYLEWRECLEAAFARGIKAGKVRKDINPRNVAAFVVAVQVGIIGTAKNAQSAELMKQAGAAFFEYLDTLRP
jgi:TetR/AcrR family transcriptional repressor of nem operon